METARKGNFLTYMGIMTFDPHGRRAIQSRPRPNNDPRRIVSSRVSIFLPELDPYGLHFDHLHPLLRAVQ